MLKTFAAGRPAETKDEATQRAEAAIAAEADRRARLGLPALVVVDIPIAEVRVRQSDGTLRRRYVATFTAEV